MRGTSHCEAGLTRLSCQSRKNDHYITNRDQWEAYVRLPYIQWNSEIYLHARVPIGNDVVALSSPSLKGLWIGVPMTKTRSAAQDWFKAILQSQTLEMLDIHLCAPQDFSKYHKLVLRSPISNSLRLLHIHERCLKE